jgi:hypothetical protein
MQLFLGNRVLSLTQAGSEAALPYLMGTLNADAAGYAQRVSLAYRDRDVGFISMMVSLDEPGHRASFVGFSPDGGFLAPRPVPLQQDLGDHLMPCSVDERKATPRVVAPAGVGQGRGVAVVGVRPETLQLSTESAVLFGTPEKPCVGALEAGTGRRRLPDGSRYWVLVYPGREHQSWVFRETKNAFQEAIYSARVMACRPETATLN